MFKQVETDFKIKFVVVISYTTILVNDSQFFLILVTKNVRKQNTVKKKSIDKIKQSTSFISFKI